METQLTLVKPPPEIKLPNLNDLLAMQQEFINAFDVKINDQVANLYVKLVEEEHEEWVEEYYSKIGHHFNELKELGDILYVTLGLAMQEGYTDLKVRPYREESYQWGITEFVAQIVAEQFNKETLEKLIYCLFGYADQMSWDLLEAYKRIHKSNMSKLGLDGKPVHREDGKVMKGPNYKIPFLEDLTYGR